MTSFSAKYLLFQNGTISIIDPIPNFTRWRPLSHQKYLTCRQPGPRKIRANFFHMNSRNPPSVSVSLIFLSYYSHISFANLFLSFVETLQYILNTQLPHFIWLFPHLLTNHNHPTMDASCGPSNALSQLSKHTQRDSSLQNDFSGRQSHPQQNGFRSHGGIDSNLNQDFQRFNTGGVSFEPQFAAHRPQIHQQVNGLPLPQMGAMGHQAWVQDFNGLTLGNNVQKPESRAAKSDWHNQFMQHKLQQEHVAQQSHHMLQGLHQNQFQNQFHSHGPTLGLDQQFRQFGREHETNMQISGSADMDDSKFDSHFDRLEKEMMQSELPVEQLDEMESDELEKERFAQAARQVKQSMISEKSLASEETSSKFHQSDFLKLMSLISTRQVEISKEGDKLVEKSSGEDIRDLLSDPLRHEKEAQPDYHQPVHLEGYSGAPLQTQEPSRFSNESQNITSHLPDPLAHIKDGSLPSDLTPLQAAKIISGGQVQNQNWEEDETWLTRGPPKKRGIMPQEWQEVYDDYRNDDDFH